ncbi:PHP domain-containing protein [Butyrivibrio sp. DSM 10294]|uniref:PHP domain-containing protein n=1 Tax=Butyrivibrio sp. DSM 10294 TaxID=2972457 RepID=UPI00234F3801|nr:PHP domain-containing protein [Butyrivibrio sp. DSM 10294]MDC7294082.1 PHP domain-containing protein [Butyrivibrio sp. DSM 10294]
MNYVYETHLHTVEASKCGKTPGKDYIDYMIDLGYSGMIVTDHFFTGNSCVPADLPWSERVEMYCSGYEHALEAAKGRDFTVMFGIEYNFQGDEYLLYGIDKEWLLAHPEIMERDRCLVRDLVHEAGGIMVQAHPYRERDYLSAIHLMPSVCDGIECYNAANPDYQNALGYHFGKEHDFLMTGGSDIHLLGQKDMGGTSFPYKIGSISEFVRAFKAGDGTPVQKRNAAEAKKFISVEATSELTTVTQPPVLPVIDHDNL